MLPDRLRTRLDESCEDALAFALEFLVSCDAEPNADGWRIFYVLEESPERLRALGLMYVLPSGELPVEISATVEGRGVRLVYRLGKNDAHWRARSDSQRWKAVYLHASEDAEPSWTWGDAIVCEHGGEVV